eukprot:CAMPEP_0182580544 /NCGR_PEP_ID=MMETSP1324-20130603/47401_1 /TAXON_ID=236786 /ORGANISM="Florenciella sp., Strain RCC1587" /LENGTH=65 /DNA_ID=CAMNT_0024796795 /DNA_START=84 /DNA_END=277 /DNA_ORIENTATION=-
MASHAVPAPGLFSQQAAPVMVPEVGRCLISSGLIGHKRVVAATLRHFEERAARQKQLDETRAAAL